MKKTEEEWREMLSPLEFHILREAGTEHPGTGALLNENRDGTYSCKACGAQLFEGGTKFDSGCGWPSFYDAKPDAVEFFDDDSLGHHRIEVRCASCGSHLGHVFKDAPQTPTGLRYCMNSVAMSFTSDAEEA